MRKYDGQTELILASASPRRQELLKQLGFHFRVHAARVAEDVLPAEAPRAYVERLARDKVAAVSKLFPSFVVLGADTTVAVGSEILGKPRHAREARSMLEQLSGQVHEVWTAVAVGGRSTRLASTKTIVEFRELSPEEIDWYVSTGEPLDKAGGYAIQGKGGAFISRLFGSYSNVVGLPLVETIDLLRGVIALPWAAP
jgi:septum formation protein